MTYYIDIPDINEHEYPWININTFYSKEKALAYVKEKFGADNEGRICLITEVEDD